MIRTRNVLNWLTILLIFASGVGAEEPKIVVPDSSPPFKPIVARIAVPNDPYSEVITSWKADDGVAFRPVRVADADELDIWATPGLHKLSCIVVIHKYKDQVVLVPDDQEPTNAAKYKTETIRISLGTSIKEYYQTFTVLPLPITKSEPETPITPNNQPPTTPTTPITPPLINPPTTPNVPNTPAPDEEITSLFNLVLRVKAKAEAVPKEHRYKSEALAGVYREAADEVIDGKLGVLNAASRLKAMNEAVLPTNENKEAWKPFLDWLGGEMTKMAVSGKLTSGKDVVAALSEISLGLSLVK